MIFLSEPRILTPEEQNSFCIIVHDSFADLTLKCVILEQVVSTMSPNLFQSSASSLGYAINITYEITSDSVGISRTLKEFLSGSVFGEKVAGVIEMDVALDPANVESEETFSMSPTPTAHSATNTPTELNSSAGKYPTVSCGTHCLLVGSFLGV